MENPTEEANDKFLFFEGYYKAAKELPPKRQLAFYEAVMAYAFYGKPLPKGGPDAALFALIQASLDKSIELSQSGRRGGLKGGRSRSEAKKTSARANGKFGGRPPQTEKPKAKPKQTQTTETETETETETNYTTPTQDARATDEKPNAAPDAAPDAAPPALRDVLRVCSNDGCTNPGGVTIPEAFGRYFFGQMQNMGWTQTNGRRVTRHTLRPVLFKWWQRATDGEKAQILGAEDASGGESEELRRIRERARENERRIAQRMQGGAQ